jgi:thymidylate synthase (FAD)
MSLEDLRSEFTGKEIKVLDDGFIRFVDAMGDDRAVVQAARVSYGEGTKHISDDEKLIRYMFRHNHGSPFEMCELKIHIRLPIVVMRQLVRHRTASLNEISGRYSIVSDCMYRINPSEWRLQETSNKQGSEGFLDSNRGEILSSTEDSIQELGRLMYQGRLAAGIAREVARKDLPLSTYTETYWKMDLRNLLHFLGLRMDDRAQYEIRQYANVIGNDLVSTWCPLSWKAFLDYHPSMGAMVLSTLDQICIQYIVSCDWVSFIEYAERIGWMIDGRWNHKNREGREFLEKIDELSLELPQEFLNVSKK